MEFFLSRYRNLTFLVLVLSVQLILLAYQVKSNQDVRLIRVWAIAGVTPLARVLDIIHDNTLGKAKQYLDVLNVKEENARLKKVYGELKMENDFLKSQLSTAENARALAAFQARSPSRYTLARIIGWDPDANSNVVLIDRGTDSGVKKGMAAVTADGIVGKVIRPFPGQSQVMLITDAGFAAGVVSQNHHYQGVLRCKGRATCVVDNIQNEEQVAVGEWFYTSGDDRIFPRGQQVGKVTMARPGPSGMQEIHLAPSGIQHGLEEVAIILEGVHEEIPTMPAGQQDIHLLAPPPPDPVAGQRDPSPGRGLSTALDHITDEYRRKGEAQGHTFGVGGRPPDFNIPVKPAEVKPEPPKQ